MLYPKLLGIEIMQILTHIYLKFIMNLLLI
nr:MAG TPA: hypothetical protein [Inoviridae sp.]